MNVAKQSVTLLDHCGSDLSVVNAARVSFHKESTWDLCAPSGDNLDQEFMHFWVNEKANRRKLSEKDEKLIKFLAQHNHKSPFNHCFMSFRVKAPIFVARQLVKHEYLPWNEVSRRYVDEEPEFFIPTYWRKKADNVKQGSSDESIATPETAYNAHFVDMCLKHYMKLLADGICAEQARMVLPQNTMTEWIWSGTLFAFAKMCNLRLDSHTQKETQEVAQMIDREARKLFPVSWKVLVGETK